METRNISASNTAAMLATKTGKQLQQPAPNSLSEVSQQQSSLPKKTVSISKEASALSLSAQQSKPSSDIQAINKPEVAREQMLTIQKEFEKYPNKAINAQEITAPLVKSLLG